MTKRCGEDDIVRWVRALNRLGRELDEWARAIHPSAWKGELHDGIARWKRVAAAWPGDAADPAAMPRAQEQRPKSDGIGKIDETVH